MRNLMDCLDKLHTTELGEERIRKNLGLKDEDAFEWCRTRICDPRASIERRGKNWYVRLDDALITVNATQCTIITAHRVDME